MTLAQPAWLFLLAGVIPVILLLHTRRRSDVIVPNLLIWRHVHTSGPAAPNPRRIRWRDRHLWLQILFACLIALALAGPSIGRGSVVDHWIFLVDTSSSMNATDVEPSRFGSAITNLADRWGSPALNGEFSLVTVGSSAQMAAFRWPLGVDLQVAVGALSPAEGEPDWQGAALRAAQLVKRDATEVVRVVVLTDAFGEAAARTTLERAGFEANELEILRLGGPLVNVGVADVVVAARGDRADQWTASGAVVTDGFADGDLVRVTASFRFPGTTVFLPWGGAEVTLDGAGTGEFTIPLDLPGEGDLRVSGPAGDHLELDDGVTVALRDTPVRVAVMGPVPDRLLAAFSAVGDVEAYSVDRDADPDLLSTYDLVVITEESSVVPQTSTLWLGTVPQGVRDSDPSTMPMLDVRSAPHVLVADVDASAMSIWRAQPLELLAGAEPLLTSDLGVLAWARTTSAGRQVVFGFGLDDSDWTSQVGFPTFVAALIEWVAPRVTRTHAVCVVGRTCALPLEAASATSRLLDPEGSPVAYATRLRQVVGDPLASAVWDPGSFDVEFVPDRSGAYSIEEGDVHVSLPVMAVPVGAQPSSVEGGVAGGSPQAAPRPLRRWLIGGAVAVVLAEVGLTMFGLRPVVRRRKRTPLVLVGLTVVAASLALLNVPVPLPTQGASLTLVGPTSSEASLRDVGARSPGWPWRWVRQWSLTEPASSGSGATQPYEPAATGADELSLAIEMALAGHADAQDRRVAVVTDAPSLTTEEVRRLAARALRLGLEVDVVRGAGSGEPGPIPEVRIERLATPHRVHAYSPFVVSTNVVAAADHGWTVRAELVSFAADAMVTPEGDADQGAPRLPDPTGLSEESGTGTETIDLEFVAGAKGDLVYRLTVTAADGTQLTDPATVVIAVGDSPSVLLVSMDDVQGLTLQAALEAQGVTVSRSTPFRMPSSAEALGVYDAVILVNVPASEMFPEYQAMLEHFVREGGGGLLVFGGVRAFGPGGYYSTPLEELSPLSSLVTDDAPEVAMAFVLDRSGSMSGAAGDTSRMELAKQATLEAISLLGDESTAAIIVFDTVAHEVVPFTSVLERNVFERALDGVTPAGGTSIYPALEAVYGLMAASDAATRHIVVMTDGLSQDGDFARAIGALNDLGVSTSFVGVGSGADRRQLSNLAGLSGGALHMARDFRSLPGLLAQEALMLSADPIEERLTRVVWAGGTTPDFLSAIADSDMPALSGYVRTTAKPEAALHLYEALEEEPILATWRYGLGRVAAFASEADGAWSQAWVGSPSYGRLWSQLVRWSAESPVRGDWSLRFAGRGGVLDVLVDVPSGTGPADELPSAELWLGELRLSTKRLTPVGDELAAVSFDVGDEWTGLLEVRIQPDEGGDPSVLVDETVAWPLAAGETVRSDLVPLEALAEATGGSSQLVTDYRLDRVGRTLTWAQQPELWLLLALASFLLALASRYGVLASPARRVSRSAAT